MPEAFRPRAVRVAVHVQRPAGEVGQNDGRNLCGVSNELALGCRRLAATCGEQHLVEVRQPQRTAEHLPLPARAQRVQRRELVRARPGHDRGAERDRRLGGGQVRAPHPIRIGLDLVVGATAEHGSGMVLGVPAVDGVLVALVDEEPLLPASSRPRAIPVATHQHQPAAQLVAVHVGVQLARGHRRGRVVGAARLPRADVPHDHVAAAVLALGDHALEVEIFDRMVLDVHGRPLRPGIQRRTSRYCPAGQDTVDLEPQVVMQAPGAVSLDDESASSGRFRRRRRSGRLGRAVEVPLLAVASELLRSLRRALRRRHGSPRPQDVTRS